MHIVAMLLVEYLTAESLTDAKFAELIGRDRTTVSRWRRGLHRPEFEDLQAIIMVTGGAVMPNDFLLATPIAQGSESIASEQVAAE